MLDTKAKSWFFIIDCLISSSIIVTLQRIPKTYVYKVHGWLELSRRTSRMSSLPMLTDASRYAKVLAGLELASDRDESSSTEHSFCHDTIV